MKLCNVEAIKQLPTLPERLRKLYRDRGRAGEFFRRMILATLAYSANRIPEIADSPMAVDRAIC